MWPRASSQIQTSVHAGGITRARMRASVSGSVTREPQASRYTKPRPARRRRIPAAEQSLRRSLTICPAQPSPGSDPGNHSVPQSRRLAVSQPRRPGSARE